MSERWTPGWTALTILVNGGFVGYVIYSYIRGSRGDEAHKPTYNLFRHPSWLNFKIWWAALANDPWTELGLMFVFMLLPMPMLPMHLHERMELMITKLGLYAVLSSAILGGPNYDPIRDYGGEDQASYIAKWVFLGVVASLIGLSYACSVKRWCIF